MMRIRLAAWAVAITLLDWCAGIPTAAADATRILRRYADDFALDPSLDRATTFGVEVNGRWWTIRALPGAKPKAGRVTLEQGQPLQPTFYFTIKNEETLARLDAGEFNALTAMGKAHESDDTPMDVAFMVGFEPGDASFSTWLIPFTFHFWTRGGPEIVPFGAHTTRVVHGANMSVLYYARGLRSAFFDIRPGQHVNADPQDQKNPFPSLFIITRGRLNAKIGGRDLVLSEGEAVLVPAGVAHEFTNAFDVPGQGVLVMFGEGA